MRHGCFAYGWSQVAIAFIQGCWREPHSPSAASASFPVIYTLPASFIYISLLASRELGFASIGTVIEPLTPTGGEASVRNAHLHNSLIKVCHLWLHRHHNIAEHKQPTVLLTRLQDVSLGEMLFLFRLGLQAKDTHSSAPQEIRSRRSRCLTLSLWFSKDGKWLLWSSRDPRPVALSYFFIFGFLFKSLFYILMSPVSWIVHDTDQKWLRDWSHGRDLQFTPERCPTTKQKKRSVTKLIDSFS